MGAGGCVTARSAAVKRAETIGLPHIPHQWFHQRNLLEGLTQEEEKGSGRVGG